MNLRQLSTGGFCSAAAFVLATFQVQADVKLHGLFTDNMVLQRNAAVPVWGWADDGEEITVQFGGQTAKTVAKDGKWSVRLKKLKAGGPEELKVTGRNSITLQNVLVGEVWIASGQSNMEWSMRASYEPETEIPKTTNPQLRLFTVPKLKANEPTNNVAGKWVESSPATTAGFSAVGYYFGRDLQKALGVPVGIIHTSWGGSPAEVWMSERVLAGNPDYNRDILQPYAETFRNYETALAEFIKEETAARLASKTFNKRAPWAPWKPTELYNGMIANLIPYAIKGAIWYQGESNADRAYQYRTLFPDMIRNWRRDWGQGDFPFLLAQLAPFKAIQDKPSESSWAELREAQELTTKTLPRVGMAVITDVGDEKDIHPKKKEPVGARLAIAARRIAYGEKIVHSGPTYKGMKVKGDKAILSFDNVGQGLAAGSTSEPLKGFAIAGEDRNFVWAHAEISGDKVIVSSASVPKPVAVRYGWADCPVVNLWNKDGLPASPFRTDNFPMITAPKQQVKK
jgi:sialate O-acetylesterase